MSAIFEHELNLPSRIWFGSDCSLMIEKSIVENQFKKIFLFIDPNVYTVEFGQKLTSLIKRACDQIVIWNHVEINVPRNLVEEAAQQIRSFDPDAIVSIGGGSTIDLSKAALVLATNQVSLDELWGGRSINNPSIPILAVPTTCGTGSDASPYAVILDSVLKCKRGIESKYIIPKEAYLDPLSLLTLPQLMIAFTGIDAFCHSMEVYVSKKSTPLTRCATIGPLVTIYNHIDNAVLYKDPKSLEALLVSATSARLLYPRTGLTIAHAMSHPLGAYYGIDHGNAVARVIIPSILFNSAINPSPYADIARILNLSNETDDHHAVAKLISWFENLFINLHIDFPRLTGISNLQEAIDEMARSTLLSSNIPSNPVPVNQKDIQKLFEQVIYQ